MHLWSLNLDAFWFVFFCSHPWTWVFLCRNALLYSPHFLILFREVDDGVVKRKRDCAPVVNYAILLFLFFLEMIIISECYYSLCSAWRCCAKTTNSCWPLRTRCAPTTWRRNCTRPWRTASCPSSTEKPTTGPTPRPTLTSTPEISARPRSWPTTCGSCIKTTTSTRITTPGIRTIWWTDSRRTGGATCARCSTGRPKLRPTRIFKDGGRKKSAASPIISSTSPPLSTIISIRGRFK